MKIIDKLCDHLIRLFNLAKSRLESRGSYTPPKNQVAPPSPPMKVWSMYGNAPCQDVFCIHPHATNIKPQESQSVTLANNSEIVFTTNKEDACVGSCSCKSKAKKKTSKKTPKKSIKKALLTKKTPKK